MFLMDIIKPILDKLETERLIENFHFLFEPNFELLFRVRIRDGSDVERTKAIISDGLGSVANLCERIDYDENYTGEGDTQADYSFGGEGWLYAQRFLDIGSRIALLSRLVRYGKKPLSAGRLDSQFNEGKFVHLLLNQHGYSTTDEANFHFFGSVERALRSLQVFSKLESMEKSLQGLRSDIKNLEKRTL
jgi:hypothetical protein